MPQNRAMWRKGWLGSDLVFDIDYDKMDGVTADGILNDRGESWEHGIEVARAQAEELERDLLRGDFGLRDVVCVFSGGRGFHQHVLDACIQSLTGEHRRQIVDYIVARGVEIDQPVTPDVHRMMRVPGSIHPKTGLECRIVSDIRTFKVPT